MAANFGSENGITVRIMTPEDYDEMNLFLREHFFSAEPLLSSCKEGPPPKRRKSKPDDYSLSMITQNTSLIAIDDATKSIVGVVLAGEQNLDDVEKHRQISETMEQNIFGRILRLTCYVEAKSNVYEKYNIDKVLFSHITCVDTKRRGQGLGGRLSKILFQVGRDKGFKAVLAHCTSFYSARQKEKLGMECIYSLPYADYKDENGEVIFTPAPPHTEVKTMAIRL